MSTIKVTTLAGRVSGTAPTLSDGATLPSGKTLSGAGGINVTGVSTFSTLKATTVSIAGTLTYEDVTNVDSVGLITARSGIVATGVVTATGFAGSNVTITSDELDEVSNSSIIFKTDGTEKVRIGNSAGSGCVGISTGNIDPDGNKLLIRGASTVGTTKGHIMLTGDSATVGQGPQIVFSESGGGSAFAGAYIGHARAGSNSLGDLRFGTRATGGDSSTVPTERLRISNTGAFGLSGANYGTSGQVLTSQGTSAAPQWADGGGVWSLINKQEITSSVSNVDVSFGANAGITTSYAQIKVYYDIWLNSGAKIFVRGAYGFSGTFANDVKTSDYWYAGFYLRAGETSMVWALQGENQGGGLITADSNQSHHSGEMIIMNAAGRLYTPGSVSYPALVYNTQGYAGGNNDAKNFTISGHLKGGDNNPLQGIRIYPSSSTLIAGEVRTYGLSA